MHPTGTSGYPIIDQYGEVVGMIRSGPPSRIQDQAILINVVREEMPAMRGSNLSRLEWASAVMVSLVAALLAPSLACSGDPTPELPRATIHEAQGFVPYISYTPTNLPEGYEMDDAVGFLDGPPYGHGIRGVHFTFRKYTPDGYEEIYIRQFLAEGMFAPTRLHLEGVVFWETVDIGDRVVVVKEVELGGGPRVVVEWETKDEGKRVFWPVDSAVSREETFLIIGSFRPVILSTR